MRTVTISVSSADDMMERAKRAFAGERQGEHISFRTTELMWRVLAPKRLDIVRAMTGEPAMSIREVARRVGRDVKAVHGDITALINAGVIDRIEGGVVFPYDDVHFDFRLAKAA